MRAWQDTVSALGRVNEFLGLGRDGELLQRVAAECSIAKMKKVDDELKAQGPEHVNLSKTGKNFIYRKGAYRSKTQKCHIYIYI